MESDRKWSTASLRVISQSLRPGEISRVLDTKPSDTTEKGSPISKRNLNGPVHQQSVWILESGLPKDQPLEMHVAKLVEYIEEKHVLLKELLSECEINLFCGFASTSGQGGIVLDTDLLKRLTILPIDFILDLYPSGVIDS